MTPTTPRPWLRITTAAVSYALWSCAPAPPPEPNEPAPVSVRVERAEPAPFRATVELFGRVGPHARVPLQVLESGKVRWAPRFAGGLRVGARVEAGELLLEIESPDVDLGVATAELEVRSALAEVERARRGVEAGFMAPIDLERAELARELADERLEHARQRRERLEVRAPASGYVAFDEPVAEGSELAAGSTLGSVGERGAPRIEGWAAARDLKRLAVGLEAECRLAGESEIVAVGRVAEVSREVEPGGTGRVVVVAAEDYGLPSPGVGVEVRVLLEERLGALSLPESAFVRNGGIASVFVLEPSGEHHRASRRVVRLGGRAAGRVEVLDGLEPGETVAVVGVELLHDGALARAASGE